MVDGGAVEQGVVPEGPPTRQDAINYLQAEAKKASDTVARLDEQRRQGGTFNYSQLQDAKQRASTLPGLLEGVIRSDPAVVPQARFLIESDHKVAQAQLEESQRHRDELRRQVSAMEGTKEDEDYQDALRKLNGSLRLAQRNDLEDDELEVVTDAQRHWRDAMNMTKGGGLRRHLNAVGVEAEEARKELHRVWRAKEGLKN